MLKYSLCNIFLSVSSKTVKIKCVFQNVNSSNFPGLHIFTVTLFLSVFISVTGIAVSGFI